MAKLVEGDGEDEMGVPGGSNLGLAVSKFLPNKDSVAWGEGQALFKAITDGDIERMKECINASPSAAQAAAIARDDDTGMTPLHYSADRGRADITEVLLANGAMVMIPPFTPSHIASYRLILFHTDSYCVIPSLNPRRHPGPPLFSPHTPFAPHSCRPYWYTTILSTHTHSHTNVGIISRINTDWIDTYWINTSYIESTHFELTHFELTHLIDTSNDTSNDTWQVNAVDRDGQTPLMLAVMCNHGEVVALLLNHGADLTLRNKHGMTAMDMEGAESETSSNFVILLIVLRLYPSDYTHFMYSLHVCCTHLHYTF